MFSARNQYYCDGHYSLICNPFMTENNAAFMDDREKLQRTISTFTFSSCIRPKFLEPNALIMHSWSQFALKKGFPASTTIFFFFLYYIFFYFLCVSSCVFLYRFFSFFFFCYFSCLLFFLPFFLFSSFLVWTILEPSSNSSHVPWIHARTNTFRKYLNPSPLTSYELNRTTYIW